MEDKTMKKYIKPETNMTIVLSEQPMLGASDVQNGGSVNKVYDENDVTYSRQSNGFWDDEE